MPEEIDLNAAHSLKDELAKLKKEEWHSPINLGHGVNTGNKSAQRRFARRLKLMQIPNDLTGKKVLDIGAWDGYFSFEFERRGAKVLATDLWSEEAFANFLFAKKNWTAR